MGKNFLGKAILMSVSTFSTLVSKADCYVEIKLPTASPIVSRTQVIDNSDNPEWNQTFQYRIHSAVKVRSAFSGASWSSNSMEPFGGAMHLCTGLLLILIHNQRIFVTLKTNVNSKVSVFCSGAVLCMSSVYHSSL